MDDHWCTNCDKAISAFSNSLYCSEECLRADALNHHPLLGYDYAELKDFPRSTSPAMSSSSSITLSPIPSFTLPSPQASPKYPYTKQSFSWDHKLSPPILELEPKLNTPPSSPIHQKRSTLFFI
ncbi:uncharacterized protein BX664DRAFT_339883 [Halteromyces radiatus]|uniref:uncharacterized protein n=1 Tax=Halteromyces radiatus TaxID=101107 RepID=UPI00221F6A5A|nr:uncharacterized protein BX664DRAFT_339883 [Halteromyces radiatus]KAI8083133.1 hypothetical protein BX664DRAFT_339883 [Halteromyces radiatus]